MKAALYVAGMAIKTFSEERQRYFEGKIKKLLETIQEVGGSSYYEKDQELKGKAEQSLTLESLMEEIANEDKGSK